MGGKDLNFWFILELKNKILAEIHNLDNKKACQKSDIPVKIIKGDPRPKLHPCFHDIFLSILWRKSLLQSVAVS